MPGLLRVHLHIRLSEEHWISIATTDLDEVGGFWRRNRTAVSTGVLHIGFDPIDPHEYESRVAPHPGRIFATPSAIHVLPNDPIDGVHISDISRALPRKPSPEASQPTRRPPTTDSIPSWLKSYLSTHPEDRSFLEEARVIDDPSYLRNENRLPDDVRERIGIHRFEYKGGHLRTSPIEVLRVAPPWAMEIGLLQLGISFATRNVLRMYGMTDLGGIARRGDDLAFAPEVTTKRLDELSRAISTRIRNGFSAMPPNPRRPASESHTP